MFYEMTKVTSVAFDSRRAEAPWNGYLLTDDGPPQNSYVLMD